MPNFYKVAFWSLLAVLLVAGVGFIATRQHYADRDQFSRIYYLERNQAEIVKYLQQRQGSEPASNPTPAPAPAKPPVQ